MSDDLTVENKSKILIIDDTPDNLRLLSTTLSEEGYDVRCAINGKLALMAIKNELPDLILLDIKMPDMDGYTVCHQLKLQPETTEIPVIFLSALDDVFDKVKAFNTGGIDYITKPFQVEEVLVRVKNQLTIFRLKQQLQYKNKQLQQLNQELIRSNQDLEQFAYVVSHDLQQPLQSITGFAEIILSLKDQINLEQEADEFITPILEEGMRMQAFIQSLLNYSRVGLHQKEFSSVDCNLMVAETLLKLRQTIQESGAIVTYSNLPVIHADSIQIGQLFQNLISNSIKYCHPHRLVKINIFAEELLEEYQFCIEDNGIGIEAQFYEKIFQVFQRLSSEQKGDGHGIGLATCKKIIERHQGRIWLESQVDIGTTFYFTIPIKNQSSHE
jgi:light-regulated signal transduction histidine kinase (bacteriophytochrome)